MARSPTSFPQTTSTHSLSELVQTLVDELNDDNKQETADLSTCSPAILTLLRSAIGLIPRLVDPARRISHHVNPQSILGTRKALETIFLLAQANINAIPFHLVHTEWLRLYTDVSILHSVLDLSTGPVDDSRARSFWLEAVRRLDMAVIVAGALGEGRAEWIQRLIAHIQQRGLPRLRPEPSRIDSCPNRLTKKPKTSMSEPSTSTSHDDLLFAPIVIPSLPSPPTMSEYLQDHRGRPFILRQYLHSQDSPCPSWQAIARWRSPEYLLDLVGEGRVVPVEVGSAYDDDDWGQKIVSFRDFLARIGYDVVPEESDNHSSILSAATAPLYLAQHPLMAQFPALERDFSIPDYVWSSPLAPESMPMYHPPSTKDGFVLNVWIGSGEGQVVSPAHTDPYYNCYAQVLGSKRVWLAPPSAGPHMYAYNGSGDTNDDATSEDGRDPGDLQQYMTNTSKVPILRPTDDFSQLRPKFPDFFRSVWPDSLEAVLEPGDLLVMPPGWWHAMRAEGPGPGWSVSMWY